ncbi:MAG: leucine-rich repeat domain-containing protein, partial [Bacteroidaceae bacterium]|nr:leucine-rich repeat domain-containing protein [Bacteroidaceae bacterium]
MKNFKIKNGIAVIPQGTKEIEHFAFNECAELKSIIIPEGVTGIGVMAFRNCTNLAHIVIPSSVKKIGNFAFENCTSLEKITIPAGVQEIGKGIFVACDALSCIVVEEGNSVYDSRKGCNAVIETVNNKLIAGCCTTIIPDDVKCIGEHAFAG